MQPIPHKYQIDAHGEQQGSDLQVKFILRREFSSVPNDWPPTVVVVVEFEQIIRQLLRPGLLRGIWWFAIFGCSCACRGTEKARVFVL